MRFEVKSYFLPCGVPENPVFEDQPCNRTLASIRPDPGLFRANLSHLRQKGRCFLPSSKNMTIICLQCLIKKCNLPWLCSGARPVDRHKAAPGGNQNHE